MNTSSLEEPEPANVSPESDRGPSAERSTEDLLRFAGGDGFAQLVLWLYVIALCWPAMMILHEHSWVWPTVGAVFMLGAVVSAGLRSELVLTRTCITVTKKWFCVTYRRRSSSELQKAWIDSNLGLGLDLRLGEVETSVGTPKSMRTLLDSLLDLRAQYGQEAPVLKAWPTLLYYFYAGDEPPGDGPPWDDFDDLEEEEEERSDTPFGYPGSSSKDEPKP
jgi:hypothetical protein